MNAFKKTSLIYQEMYRKNSDAIGYIKMNHIETATKFSLRMATNNTTGSSILLLLEQQIIAIKYMNI